jgi:hypothetical protein
MRKGEQFICTLTLSLTYNSLRPKCGIGVRCNLFLFIYLLINRVCQDSNSRTSASDNMLDYYTPTNLPKSLS